MSWSIGRNEYDQYAKVWEIDDQGTYALVKLGTSRKDKRTGEYVNSTWGFCRFVSAAYEDIENLSVGDRIIIVSGTIERAPYEKDGEKVYPKNERVTIFKWKFTEDDNDKDEDTDKKPSKKSTSAKSSPAKTSSSKTSSKKSKHDEDDDDEIPF